MQDLLTFLGVAFIARFELGYETHPAYERFKRNAHLFADLCSQPSLRDYLSTTEIILRNTHYDRAFVCFLGCAFRLASQRFVREAYTSDSKYEKLRESARGFLRIRFPSGDSP